jgi:hypothetical protein
MAMSGVTSWDSKPFQETAPLRESFETDDRSKERCEISPVAGGAERGRPARRGAQGRYERFCGEHRVGLFGDRSRLGLTLQRTPS